MEEVNLQTFIPVTGLEGKLFRIEDYQRGYKWGKPEIIQLLEDIDKHNAQNGPYCLQPIIVKPLSNQEFEVIDGQQRLTSLFLLMQYFSSSGTIIEYNIEYNTRTQSQLFLKNPKNFSEILASENWLGFIKTHSEFNNVDVFHFYEVYKAIHLWFENKSVTNFNEKLRKCPYIIWYDVTQGNLKESKTSSAETIFISFNGNKVDLSSSELIKALFILDHEGTHTKEQKKHNAIELALEWDAIENQLQDDTFWYFICNNEKYNHSATRIDFLFDLIKGDLTNKDELAAYRKYEKLITSEAQKDLEWKKVKTCFYKLDEWNNDNEIYHKVGYLIASRLSDIQTILLQSNKKSKIEFKKILTDRICSEFKREIDKEPVYNIDKLTFDEFKKECNLLLLLLNVFRYFKDVSSNKFPFNLYHEKSWSLEHINPQNPEGFEDKAMLKNWVDSIEDFIISEGSATLEEINNYSDAIEKLKSIIDQNASLEEIYKQPEFEELVSKIVVIIKVHNVSNLALLDRNTNSALGNKPYLEKREKLLRFDRKGFDDKGNEVYIPICTRDLFTKTYSFLTRENVGTYFTAKDMADYKSFIKEELKEFLPQVSATNEAV